MSMTSATDGVQCDINRLPEDLRDSGLAAVALAMAERIDANRGSPSECGRVIIEALEQLRALVPPEEENDQLDDLSARRTARIARSATA